MSTPLTFEEAYELLDQAETKDDIRAVINRISVGSGDAISVLFSGAHSLSKTSGKGMIGTVDLANALAANADGVRVMGNTDMGRFMITDKDAPDANFKLIRALNRVCNGDTDEIKRFMYGHYEDGVLKEPGLWDDASARFVHNIKGDVLTFTGNANIDRIFARTELPILLENTNVKSIDGIPRELLAALPKDNGIPKEAFEAIRTMSALRTARLGIPVSEEGLPIAERGRVTIESREFLAGLKGLTHKPVDPTLKFEKLGGHFDVEMARTHTQGLQVLRKLEIDLTPVLERPMDAKIASFLLGSLNRFGILFDAVDVFRLGYVGLEAKQAYDQGDREKGDSLLSKWALENGGALLGGRIGAALGLAILGGATGGLGLVVGLGLGLLGAHLGSTYGDEAFAIVAHGLADLHAWTLARLRQLFGDAEHHISPIILDLDGNGIDTLAMSDWRIHFDHDHNGFAERTGWVGPRDGLLVRDLDGNGLIDTGKELFGNYSQLGDGRSASHGFEALATLDEDRNGILNSNDSGWRSIAIWVDANSSATVEPGEIKSLSSLRIESLSLNFRREKIIDRQGNKHVEISSYTRDDASSYAMHDVWFAIDQNQSIDRQGEPTTPWLKRIPNLHGSSVVPNLRQAISDDASGRLITLLEKWVKAADQDRSGLLNEFIFAWTGVTATTTSSVATLEHFYQQKLYTLERLLGKSYRSDADYRNPSSTGLALLDQAFEDVKRSIAISLIAQNELIVLLRLTQELTDARTGKEGLDASKAARWIERYFDPLRDQQRLRDLGQAMKLLPDQGKALADGLRREWNSDISQIVLLALVLDDSSLRAGSVESDWISDTSGSDILSALNGHDQLHSTSGRDIHIGDKGNDVITSGAGDDLFVFSRGDGQDLISDMDDTPANLDTVQLLNLNPSDLSAVLRHDHDLQLIFHSGDRLSVAQYFVSTRHRIEQFHFADGSQWSHKELLDLVQVAGATAGHDALGGYNDICNRIDGLDGNDYLAGGLLNDVLRGNHGHDQLIGQAGDDLLEGGTGDDQLRGDSGRDSLHGGLGNDRLEGGEGDDVYHFSRGDGQDLISDMDDTPANLDVVQL
ncbi:MAG: calcium-binding protein, partial [Synechococcaceae cyanobacterium]